MTLAQLQSFVLVARHGSVKAAAAELEVTEPAVSVAVAALRKELGDELFVRNGRGIALTPGGRRLAALASEILGLAEQARRSVAESGDEPRRMQVVATQPRRRAHRPADRAVHRREEGVEVAVETVAGRRVRRPARASPRRHRARAAPGRGARDDDRLGAVPALPADRRRRARRIRWPARARSRPPRSRGERWLVGQPELDPTTGAGLFFARTGLVPGELATYSSHAPRRSPPPPPARGSCSRSPTPSSRRSGAARSCGSTCAGRRASSCGTRARSAWAGRCPPRWRSSASRRRPTRPRRSRPAAPARSRRTRARRCT